MKSTFQILAMLCVVGFFAFSCSSDDDNGSPQTEGAITFKVDGQQFATVPMVSYAMISEGVIYISGVTADDIAKTINLSLEGSEVGTYIIGENHLSSGIIMDSIPDETDEEGGSIESWSAPYGNGVNGEVVVTNITSTHVSGTFQFKAKNIYGDQSVRVISEGSFNVKIFQFGGM